jgi:hypothetical protein
MYNVYFGFFAIFINQTKQNPVANTKLLYILLMIVKSGNNVYILYNNQKNPTGLFCATNFSIHIAGMVIKKIH